MMLRSVEMGRFPATTSELLRLAGRFVTVTNRIKKEPPGEGVQWYPYDTMASLAHLAPLLEANFAEFERAVHSGPMLDIGCGDGDLSLFFASLGHQVTAADNPPTNYNWMRGVRALSERMRVPVDILEIDVDSQFTLPEESYGLAMLLGILYHLKNPYYVMETLARRARYCVLSTRVATETKAGLPIDHEPVAYLLDHREANDDATNFWIFSPSGLRRLARRTGWRIVGETIVGCVQGSNPVDPDRDGRMFLILQSQRLSIPARVQLLDGWTPITEFNWAWTLKAFSFEAQVLDSSIPVRFFLRFTVIPQLTARSPVKVGCRVNGIGIAPQVFDRPGDYSFEAAIPEAAQNAPTLRFDFSVEHEFSAEGDARPLGIIVPFRGTVLGTSEKFNFWMG